MSEELFQRLKAARGRAQSDDARRKRYCSEELLVSVGRFMDFSGDIVLRRYKLYPRSPCEATSRPSVS